uniref:Transcription factor bHLH041 family n=1 Tax=Cajanus cajan TaxID=3821 RepID=A0A151SS20_CAJCA|nr:Putative transcription factor bHLH041 family [Cajanus cajan]
MDGVFSLTEAVRAEFLCSLVHSFGCTYVSLWQYDSNLSNRLFFLDGFYDVMNNQLRSSLGNVAESLFHQYQTLTFHVHDGCVPGVAFTNHIPYLELQRSDLLRLTSNEIQAQFFQVITLEIIINVVMKETLTKVTFMFFQEARIEVCPWWKKHPLYML